MTPRRPARPPARPQGAPDAGHRRMQELRKVAATPVHLPVDFKPHKGSRPQTPTSIRRSSPTTARTTAPTTWATDATSPLRTRMRSFREDRDRSRAGPIGLPNSRQRRDGELHQAISVLSSDTSTPGRGRAGCDLQPGADAVRAGMQPYLPSLHLAAGSACATATTPARRMEGGLPRVTVSRKALRRRECALYCIGPCEVLDHPAARPLSARCASPRQNAVLR